jgi:hypothetical protein
MDAMRISVYQAPGEFGFCFSPRTHPVSKHGSLKEDGKELHPKILRAF